MCEEAEARLSATNLELCAQSDEDLALSRCRTERRGTGFIQILEEVSRKSRYFLSSSCFVSECALKSDEIEPFFPT